MNRLSLGSFTNAMFFAAMMVGPTEPTTAQSFQISGKTHQKQERKISVSNETQLKGQALRKAIDNTYKKLNEANAVKSMGNGRNMITDVVLSYIPIGTSFDDAESILRAAGFTVGPRRNNPIFTESYEVNAKIEFYARLPLGRVDIYVSLIPKSKNDWGYVQNLSAEIIKQTL